MWLNTKPGLEPCYSVASPPPPPPPPPTLSPQDSMELVFKQSKAVAVTSMSFPHGDVNNFVVGSEDGSVYMACRHGRWVPPGRRRVTEAAFFSPPRTECQINAAHSPPSVAQIQHSVSCWRGCLSCPVILFVFSTCQLCLQRSFNLNRAHTRRGTHHSFLSILFSPSLWWWGGVCV